MNARRLSLIVLRGLAAGTAVVAVAVAVSAAFFPVTSTSVDLEAGSRIFSNRCAGCHSLDPARPTGLGPPLYGIAETAATRIAGLDAEEYIVRSIIEPAAFRASSATGEMPQNIASDMNTGDVLSLTAFLMSQGGTPRYRRLLQLSEVPRPAQQSTALQLTLATVERGRKLYFDEFKCNSCHPLDGSGSSLLAPSLLHAGLHERQYLEQAIRRPGAKIVPGYQSWTVLHQGLAVTGRRLPTQPGRVRLLSSDAAGISVSEFDEADLEEVDGLPPVIESTESAMPASEQMSDKDLSALVEFLSTLR